MKQFYLIFAVIGLIFLSTTKTGVLAGTIAKVNQELVTEPSSQNQKLEANLPKNDGLATESPKLETKPTENSQLGSHQNENSKLKTKTINDDDVQSLLSFFKFSIF